jgi:hypothetical protein
MEGYSRSVHIHGGGDFGIGITSTSHIESIWSQLKSILKKIYYVIPSKNFFYFLKEAEWRVKNKNKHLDNKISEFFDNWKFISDFDNNDFINIYD